MNKTAVENQLWIEAIQMFNKKEHTQDGRNLVMEHFRIIRVDQSDASLSDLWDKVYLDWHKSYGSESLKKCVVRAFEQHASLQCAEMKKENDELRRWKEIELRTWEPLINWFQSNRSIPPGESLLDNVLLRVTEYESLKKRIEELEAFLYRLEANPESGEAWVYTEAASLLMDIKSKPHDTINKP